MPPLYLTQQLAKVRIRKGRLLVEHEGETLAHLPLGHVSEVVLFGNIGLSTPAIGVLLARGIDVVFLTVDGGLQGAPFRRADAARAAAQGTIPRLG